MKNINTVNDSFYPLVSIVIPTFNHGHYLGRALRSVLDQTYSNWEAIVVDNYSTDTTDDVMSDFYDERIKYIKFRNNGVIAASRNVGIKVATGEWIAFLDSDDWWHPDKLKEIRREIDVNRDVIYHELEVVTRRKKWRKSYIGSWQVRPPVQVDLIIRGNALATSSVVVRRETLYKTTLFNESPSMVTCEDYNLWLQIGGVTNNFYFYPKSLGYYMSDGNGMSSKTCMSSPTMRAIDPFIHKLSLSQRKYVEARVNYAKLRYAYLNRDNRLALSTAFKSIASGPILLRVKSIFMVIVSVMRSVRF